MVLDGQKFRTLNVLCAFEKCYKYETELRNLFSDFQQAFDAVSRNTMLNRFKEMGMPMKIIRLINMTLNNCKAQIAVEDKLTPTLEINADVSQGDPLSALLFNLTLESVIRNLETRGNITT
jgi:hypothetical protein